MTTTSAPAFCATATIAFAIAKERITREKHASGFYQEVIDYCLDAEGITLDDVESDCPQLLHPAG